MVVLVLITVLLVVVLHALILRINHGRHYAPQAYHYQKQEGAPLASGVPRLAPRRRREPPAQGRD